MRIYFERLLICSKCGDTERQTAFNTSFDRIGKALHAIQINEFIETHNQEGEEKCNAWIRFSSWKVGRYNYLN